MRVLSVEHDDGSAVGHAKAMTVEYTFTTPALQLFGRGRPAGPAERNGKMNRVHFIVAKSPPSENNKKRSETLI
jgi:hypothetical protein